MLQVLSVFTTAFHILFKKLKANQSIIDATTNTLNTKVHNDSILSTVQVVTCLVLYTLPRLIFLFFQNEVLAIPIIFTFAPTIVAFLVPLTAYVFNQKLRVHVKRGLCEIFDTL